MSGQLSHRYREAAQRLFPTAKISRTSHVHIMADGAFVEVVMWVPVEEALKEQSSEPAAETEKK